MFSHFAKHFERYTLPLIAFASFVGIFSLYLIIGIVPSQQKMSENSSQVNLSTFPNQTMLAAASGTAVEDDLVAYWTFDEGEGVTLLDHSFDNNTGIIKGNPVWVKGKEGEALLFDGVNDYVEVDGGRSLNLSSAFTIAAWVRTEDSSQGTIISKNGLKGTSRGGYKLSINNDGLFYSIAGTSSLGDSSLSIKPQKWVYVLVSYDVSQSPRVRLYVNGKRVLSGEIPPPKINNQKLLIGRAKDGSFFKGSIDELRIYNRALSDAEVGVLYEVYLSQEGRVTQGDERTSSQTDKLPSLVANVLKGWSSFLFSKK